MTIKSTMRHINSGDFKTHFGEYLELVNHEPITINKLGKPAAVLLSVTEYARLHGLDELLDEARKSLPVEKTIGYEEVVTLLLLGFSPTK